jgi:Flp pilus assembly protein TadG
MHITPPTTLRSDIRGGIAVTFGLTAGILMLFVSLAVDMARLSYVQSKVAQALDSASLAGAKRLDDAGVTAADIELLAKAYFDQNVGASGLYGATLSNFQASPDFATGTVQSTVDVRIPILFAAAGGAVRTVTATPRAAANYRTLRIEVAMVLDTTGSMNEPSADGTPKLDSLKRVAKDFIDALYVNKPEPGFVRVSLAPYSSAINIGSRAETLAGFGTDTCVVDRNGPAAYTDAPSSWPSHPTRGSVTLHPWYVCPTAQVVPLTDLVDPSTRDNFKLAIDQMAGNGGTSGHIGLEWGFYLLSPTWSTSYWGGNGGRAYADNVKKIMVVLTDGIFNTAYNNGGSAFVDNGNPDPAANPAIDPTVPGTAAYQALMVCDKIKTAVAADKAITIYTVGFTTPPAAEQLLKDCSGASNFYSAADSTTLSAAFRSIASKLTNLRISS